MLNFVHTNMQFVIEFQVHSVEGAVSNERLWLFVALSSTNRVKHQESPIIVRIQTKCVPAHWIWIDGVPSFWHKLNDIIQITDWSNPQTPRCGGNTVYLLKVCIPAYTNKLVALLFGLARLNGKTPGPLNRVTNFLGLPTILFIKTIPFNLFINFMMIRWLCESVFFYAISSSHPTSKLNRREKNRRRPNEADDEKCKRSIRNVVN